MTEDFKSWRLPIIAEAAEKVRAEREVVQQNSDEFNLDEVDHE